MKPATNLSSPLAAPSIRQASAQPAVNTLYRDALSNQQADDGERTGEKSKISSQYVPIQYFKEKYRQANVKPDPKPSSKGYVEDMFDEARCIVGISPVSRDDILHYAWKGIGFNQDVENDTDSKVFYSPIEERDQVARHICENKLEVCK